ncbi:DUF1870 family protein [Undibacterium sp. TJN19]|uniref:Aca2/YdiL-like domain-containing protein n=1 Tax=Undibacterium sp. TJN19 TaxID=3413055 RepID=UPI003BF11E6F
MNGPTLKALRSLLFFTMDEAAIFVGGGVSLRSWQYWEAGNRPVPPDVAESVGELAQWRVKAVAAANASVAQALSELPDDANVDPIRLVSYASVEDWMTLPGREPVLWKPNCSVIAEICARHHAQIIVFDGPAYSKWLAGRHDDESMRGQWAAETLQ